MNHISSDLCKNNGIEIKPENRVAVMANSSKESVKSTLKTCMVSIGPYSETMNLVVTGHHYDLVLGK